MKLHQLCEANISGSLYRNSHPFDLDFFVLKGTKEKPRGYTKKAIKTKDTLHAYQPHKIHGNSFKGSSMTRSKHQAFKIRSFGDVVLEFDADKLSQTHKIIPVDAEYVHYLARVRRQPNDPVARRAWSKHNDRSSGTGTHEVGTMAEEFVVGDISPLSRYLKKIYVFPDAKETYDYEAFVQSVKEYSEEYNVPVEFF